MAVNTAVILGSMFLLVVILPETLKLFQKNKIISIRKMTTNTKLLIGGGIALISAGIYVFMPDMWSGRSRYTDWRDRGKPLKGVKGAAPEYRETPRTPQPNTFPSSKKQ